MKVVSANDKNDLDVYVEKDYVLIKDFNRFMFNQTKPNNRKKKIFCPYFLQCFSSEDALNRYKTECIIINGQQGIQVPQKGVNIVKC